MRAKPVTIEIWLLMAAALLASTSSSAVPLEKKCETLSIGDSQPRGFNSALMVGAARSHGLDGPIDYLKITVPPNMQYSQANEGLLEIFITQAVSSRHEMSCRTRLQTESSEIADDYPHFPARNVANTKIGHGL